MAFTSYFSDNQTKQKAYDRYYDQMARRDFVQRRKVKALIAQEASDEALTDKLAQLYMSSVGKAPEYEYDQVLNKIKKSGPGVPTPKNPANPANQSKFSQKMKDRIAGESYDAPADDLPFKDPNADREGFKYFKSGDDLKRIFENARKDAFKAKSFADAKKIANEQAQRYVDDYQKKARADKVHANRVLNRDEAEEAKAYVVKNVMAGYKHERSMSEDSTRNGKSERKKPTIRDLTDEFEDAADEPDESIPKDMREKLYKESLKNEANGIIRQFSIQNNHSQPKLKKKIASLFKAEINKAKGPGYFEEYYPTISTTAKSLSSFANHKRQVKEFLNKAFA